MTVSLESSTADIISEKLKLAIFGSSADKSDKRLRQYYNKLLKLERGNAITLADYTLSYRQDNPGLAATALATYGLYLVRFAQKVNKPFGDMTLNDLSGYLETLKKPDSDKWRETWNLFLVIITRFFKWFYYPNIPDGERPKPAVVAGLKKAKPKGGKRKKVFGPKDLWDEEDNEIFFKYCPDSRIKGYHGLAIDTGARPHELLQLKMQDIVWPPDGQGPKLSLNGKTGPRTVRSMRYYRYVREWQEQHPKRSIPSAILFPSKKTGGILNVGSLRTIYIEELRPFFTKLKDEAIGQEDRNRINRLLEKSWTPKVFRHTTATEYSPILSAPDANQWFGWTENSNTSSFYRHYNGDEASKSLMEAFGIVPKQRALPKMKECPNVTCKELNTPDAPFCVKCRVPLTVAAHIEEGHRKDEEIEALRNEQQMLKEHMTKMEESQLKITELLEVMKIAKSSDGKVGKDMTMLDEERRVTFGYVDNNNQIVEVKIPLDGVEIDRVDTSRPPNVSIPIDGAKANNFIRQVSKDVAKQATKKNP